MRTLLATALLVPLLSVAIRDSSHRAPPPTDLPSFPLSASDVAAPSRSATVLLVPLTRSAESFSVFSAANGIPFDIEGDGAREQVAWPDVGADIAFLAIDADGDGLITSGKELVGPAMTPGAKNAFTAFLQLQRADAGTNWAAVQAGDPLYERLLLWIDRNHNGIGERRELRPAREVFTAIGLGYSSLHRADPRGNRVDWEGWMELRTGGPDQTAAHTPNEQRSRLRHYFETKLAVRD